MKKILLILFLLVMPFVSAGMQLDAGESYTLEEVECYGDYIVKYRSVAPLEIGDINFVNCEETQTNRWTCACKNGRPQTIQFTLGVDVKNEFDFTSQYYITHVNESAIGDLENLDGVIPKRTHTFTNYNVDLPIIKKTYISLTTQGTGVAIAILIVVFTIVGAAIYFVYKMIMTDNSNTTEFSRIKEEPETKDDVDISDEEIDKYLEDM